MPTSAEEGNLDRFVKPLFLLGVTRLYQKQDKRDQRGRASWRSDRRAQSGLGGAVRGALTTKNHLAPMNHQASLKDRSNVLPLATGAGGIPSSKE